MTHTYSWTKPTHSYPPYNKLKPLYNVKIYKYLCTLLIIIIIIILFYFFDYNKTITPFNIYSLEDLK